MLSKCDRKNRNLLAYWVSGCTTCVRYNRQILSCDSVHHAGLSCIATSKKAAHTLKGVCMNLGFERLLHSSSMLTESLRNGVGENMTELFQQVQQDYDHEIPI